jgi:hypothetical protein
MARRYAKGRHAVAIDDRTGFKVRYKDCVIEPGTGYLVHRSESDGRWSYNKHPQNFAPKNLRDGAPLKNARVDRIEYMFSVLYLGTEDNLIIAGEDGFGFFGFEATDSTMNLNPRS